MATCSDCGDEIGSQSHHEDCLRGNQRFQRTTTSPFPAGGLPSQFVDFLGGRDSAIRISTYAVAVAAVVGTAYFGGLPILLIAFPLLAGGVVILARPHEAKSLVDRFGRWLSLRKAVADAKEGNWARYVSRPCFGGFAYIQALTDRIADDFMRAGVRIASYLYFAALILLVAYVAVAIVIVIALVILVLVIASLIFSLIDKSNSASGPFSRSSSSSSGGRFSLSSRGGSDRLVGTEVVKEGLIFDTPTGIKVNEQGQVVREGLLLDSPTGIKVSESGQVVSEGFFLDTPTGVKVQEDGQIVKEGLIFDAPTGYKVNERGQLVKEGMILDTPTGTRFKKKNE